MSFLSLQHKAKHLSLAQASFGIQPLRTSHFIPLHDCFTPLYSSHMDISAEVEDMSSAATHSSIFAWRIHGQKRLVGTVHRVTQSWTWRFEHACITRFTSSIIYAGRFSLNSSLSKLAWLCSFFMPYPLHGSPRAFRTLNLFWSFSLKICKRTEKLKGVWGVPPRFNKWLTFCQFALSLYTRTHIYLYLLIEPLDGKLQTSRYLTSSL